MDTAEALESAIAALEAQRPVVGAEAVEAGIAALRDKLAALGAEVQRRRQVTVLFMDVVGSTRLGQQLDPEDLHEVLDGLLAAATVVVESHSGRVLQYAGDGLLAAFGAHGTSEDDPERAVRTGLALLATARDRAGEFERRFTAAAFDVRIGIHTGPVLLGGGVDDEGTIRGVAVHIAARLEQSAAPGTVLISQTTYGAVRGGFEVEAQPPMSFKGLDQPLTTYRVLSAKPRTFRAVARGVEGVETPMVGRDAQIRRLQEVFESLQQHRGLRVVTISGEAGLGKSRLLYEFENWTRSQPAAFANFRGRALPQTRTQPYALMRDLFALHFELVEGDSVDVARRKIEDGVAPWFDEDLGRDIALGHAHVLGHLIGLPLHSTAAVAALGNDAAQLRARAFHVACQLLERVARRGDAPVLMLLDDVHWADDGSLDFLVELTRAGLDRNLLLLCGTRPELFERRPDWMAVAECHETISLEPLGSADGRKLADHLLQRLGSSKDAVHTMLTRSAAGNPYYMEELLKMLVDEGIIDTARTPWHLHTEQLRTLRIPPTLTGVLQARLDSLRVDRRHALQQASIVGAVFWDGSLSAIDTNAPAALPALAERELVVAHERSLFASQREFAFRHQLLHQVTYETVLKRERSVAHACVAAWLAALDESEVERAHPLPALIADHYERAGDAPMACEYYARAAEQAAERCAPDAAMSACAKALELRREGDDEMLWRLTDLREREFESQGDCPAQSEALATLQRLADAAGNEARRADVTRRLAHLAYHTGDYAAARAQAQRACELAHRADDQRQALRAQQTLAISMNALGELDTARALALEGLAAARQRSDRHLESRFVNALSVIATRQGDLYGSYLYDQEMRRIACETGNLRDEAAALGNLGVGLMGFGDFDAARDCLNQSLHLARAVGARFVEPHVLRYQAELAVLCGDCAAAVDCAQQAIACAVRNLDKLAEAEGTQALADGEFQLGRNERARSLYERSFEMCSALGSPIALDARAGLARAALVQGDAQEALRQVEAVLEHQLEHGNLDGSNSPQLIRLVCWTVLRACGDTRAADLLEQAHESLMSQVARLGDARMRELFMTRVPANVEIARARNAIEGRG